MTGLLLLRSPVSAQENSETSFRLGAALSHSFGDTRYELRAKVEDPGGSGELVDVKSQLEFPLDAVLLGLVAQWTPGHGPSRRWTLEARVDFSVTDPSGKMTDEDWIDSKQISYTESTPELDMILVMAELRYHTRQQERIPVDLLFHFDYQKIEQHIVGYEGWRGSIFSDQQFPVSGDAPVLDYTVEYLSPQLGADAALRSSEFSSFSLQATAGVVYASDTDDHLLRGRISEGSGWGFGSNARLEFALEPGFMALRWLSLSVLGELSYFHAEGDTDQRWYRDEDLPAGTEINDIPYTIESRQARIGIALGASF